MTGIWVDTDFGFDDLWALLVLRHLGCAVAGVSLVAGNASLAQVAANAAAAKAAYGLNWPVWQGADRPLERERETAERILGPTGMRSRGLQLERPDGQRLPDGALDALGAWLSDTPGPHEILALGPLTNIALFQDADADLASQITRLVWMGGSAGPGNHTPLAEYNAFADAEALARVVASGIPLDIADLMFCRSVTFGPQDMPRTDTLTRDLLGGYLDIALERGRPGMAIYDPLAALAIARPDSIGFKRCSISVATDPGRGYGATGISFAKTSHTRISTEAKSDLAQICLGALEREPAHGPGK